MSRPRLTGGVLRGRVLPNEVADGVRPTAARVREALFSIVGQDLAGDRVLDAFGGAGLLALEAWSRGAEVVVVERDPATAQAIRANASGLGARLDVRTGDARALAPSLGRFDLVFVDPPYKEAPGPILTALLPTVGGWLVLESDAAVEPPEVPGLEVDRRRLYGGAALTVYRSAG